MRKRLFSILLATIMMLSTLCLSLVSVNAVEGNKEDGEYFTYYFYAPSIMFKSNSSLGYYYYTPEENAKWPGEELKEEDACVHTFENGDKIFKVQIWQENSDTADEMVTTPVVIFNSFVDGEIDPVNAVQTTDIALEGFYEGVETALEFEEFAYGEDETKYPRYKEDIVSYNFNNMIYVPTEVESSENAFGDVISKFNNGMWYYYYGEGEYGVTANKPSDGKAQLGDVDGDGNIAMLDVVEIQKSIASLIKFTDEQKALADVNKDGEVTMVDVTTMQQFIAKIITEF